MHLTLLASASSALAAKASKLKPSPKCLELRQKADDLEVEERLTAMASANQECSKSIAKVKFKKITKKCRQIASDAMGEEGSTNWSLSFEGCLDTEIQKLETK